MKISRKTKRQTNKDIKYYMKFMDRFRFMSTLLLNFTDILFGKLHGKNVVIVKFFLNMKKLIKQSHIGKTLETIVFVTRSNEG